MPQLDGLGLIRKVRGDPDMADLPIFMLTAKSYELSSEELTDKWNVTAVIPKPFSPRELLQHVEAALQEQAPVEATSG